MTPISTKVKAITAGAACAGIGALAGIAGASAAPSAATQHHSKATRHAPRGLGFPGPGGVGFERGPAVHADAVVLNRAGTAFITQTIDAGTLVADPAGGQLQVDEKLGTVDYKTVTLSIPAGATIVRDGAKATLADLKPNDHVRVVASSDGTFVMAVDPSFAPRFGGPGERHRGFGGPGDHEWGPGAPPPPGAPGAYPGATGATGATGPAGPTVNG